jgi:hypothetical protein
MNIKVASTNMNCTIGEIILSTIFRIIKSVAAELLFAASATLEKIFINIAKY